MIDETKKLLDKKINVFATCVRVPVFIGHGESITIETEKAIDLEKVRKVVTF